MIGLANIEEYLRQFKGEDNVVDQCFDLDWDIRMNSLNMSPKIPKQRKSALIFLPEEENSEFSQNLCSEIDSIEFYTAHGESSWDEISEQ